MLKPADGSGKVSSITYSDVGNAITMDAGSKLSYQPEQGRYYVWTEGQAKTNTTLEIYKQESFNLLGFDWDGLVPDTAANYSDTRFTDGTPLKESELALQLSLKDYLFVQYEQKRNLAVDVTKDKTQVRDVATSNLYLYIGETCKLSFPLTDFTDTSKWKFLEKLSGGS